MIFVLIFMAPGCYKQPSIDEIYNRRHKKLSTKDKEFILYIFRTETYKPEDEAKLIKIGAEQAICYWDYKIIDMISQEFKKDRFKEFPKIAKTFFTRQESDVLLVALTLEKKIGALYKVREIINLEVDSIVARTGLILPGGFSDSELLPHLKYLSNLHSKTTCEILKKILKIRIDELPKN